MYNYFIMKDGEPFAHSSSVQNDAQAEGWLLGVMYRYADEHPDSEWEVYSLRNRCALCGMPMPVDTMAVADSLCPKCRYSKWACAQWLGVPTHTLRFCPTHAWAVHKEWGCEECVGTCISIEVAACVVDPGCLPLTKTYSTQWPYHDQYSGAAPPWTEPMESWPLPQEPPRVPYGRHREPDCHELGHTHWLAEMQSRIGQVSHG